MKPRISLITLGVDDLETSLAFYRDGLGLKTEGIVEGGVAFFDLEAGLKLALYPRASLARDAGLAAGARSAAEFSLAHNVMSKDEVDAVMEQARRAGAVIVKEAEDTFCRVESADAAEMLDLPNEILDRRTSRVYSIC